MVIELEGKSFYLDLKKILDFVHYSNKHPLKESEITDLYQTDEEVAKDSPEAFGVTTKTIRETTSFGVSQIDNIRYDLVKTMLMQVLEFGYEETDKIDNIPFGLEVAINTLITEGFLKEIE